MRRKKLGRSDLELSVVGLGTWAMGGSDWAYSWGSQDDNDSISAIHQAMDLGINWIDTAPVYGMGHAEEVVGKAISTMKEKPLVFSKCGLVWNDKRKVTPLLKRESVKNEINASLKRLQIEVIDLYQIHWPRPDEDIEEAWEVIAGAVKAGKIRYAGVCNFNVDQLIRVESIHPAASLQPPYSMIERDIEEEILPYCATFEKGVIVYSPMQKGLLTGKYTKENIKQLSPDDHRKYDIQFKEPILNTNLWFIEGLKPIAEKNKITLAQLAIAWTLNRREVTAAIVGARNASQIGDTARAGDWVLSDVDIALIDSLIQERQERLIH
ncbi:MAG: aldo/keto reductase [Spirochaetes bacterium]|nr:aldo/keto reductase [Spirochaetota bacterium]